mmetsp:Transcript_9676/g.25855  ORF Transcript_9676/g.25855 Transcript_9676/m.25855 type:complete len:231 (+) Transcript_9676:355-1047(+)
MEGDVFMQHALELLLLQLAHVGPRRNGVRVLRVAWKAVEAGAGLPGSPPAAEGYERRGVLADPLQDLRAAGVVRLPLLSLVHRPHVHEPVGHLPVVVRDAGELPPAGGSAWELVRVRLFPVQLREAVGPGRRELAILAELLHPQQHGPVRLLPRVPQLAQNLVLLPVPLEVRHVARLRRTGVDGGPHGPEPLGPLVLIALVDTCRTNLVANRYGTVHGGPGSWLSLAEPA